MKVILREDVKGLGAPGKVVEVAPGYARNYLLPRKLAIEATPGNIRNLEQYQRMLDRKHTRLAATAEAMARRLGELTVTLEAKAGEAGRIYGSITSTDIAEGLAKQFEITIDRRKIELPEPIRLLGQHEAQVHLHHSVIATLRVNVTPIGGEPIPVVAEAAEPAEEASPGEPTPEVETTAQAAEEAQPEGEPEPAADQASEV